MLFRSTTVGTVLPQFTEEYGEGKRLDIVVTPSHKFFKEGIPGSKQSSIYMDKSGNWKIQLNIALQLLLEKETNDWQPVRNLYA